MLKGFLIMFVIAAVVLGQVAPCYAGDAFRKLGRGVCNIATGWAEVPVQIMRTTRDEGHVAALTVGVVKGIFFAIGRTLIGGLETATFFIPAPAGYRPLIEPEFVLEPIST